MRVVTSTGLRPTRRWLGPVVADLVCVHIYIFALIGTVALWAVWQGRGQKTSDEIETSSYGRPLVKA